MRKTASALTEMLESKVASRASRSSAMRRSTLRCSTSTRSPISARMASIAVLPWFVAHQRDGLGPLSGALQLDRARQLRRA